MMIKKFPNLNQYPIPSIDDLYAKLVCGQKFTKLDLSIPTGAVGGKLKEVPRH